MRLDCAMASGLRVGPSKIEPETAEKHSEIDLEKKSRQKFKTMQICIDFGCQFGTKK